LDTAKIIFLMQDSVHLSQHLFKQTQSSMSIFTYVSFLCSCDTELGYLYASAFRISVFKEA